jgi:transposase-like protein
METKELKVRVCPICGQEYTDRPAISRTDGETPICPDCGTRQALESLGIDTDEQEKIITAIHRSMGRNTQIST